MDVFPPPHMVCHEPLDETMTRIRWKEYTQTHELELEASEIDAAEVCSVEEFSKQFEIWVTAKSQRRIKVLMVWHSHFLSLACQQTLRRWLETKSYKCRVWFHVELLNNIQNAILSRCVLRYIVPVRHTVPQVVGSAPQTVALWKRIVDENELRKQPLNVKK